MISFEQIQQLYDRYLDLITLEVVEFGVRPTEVTHLLGRLGEFHCALKVRGTLAHHVNQHGFDVICEKNRRISVKTTAQVSGFVGISKSTINRADDLMVVQFLNGELFTVYYGPVEPAIAVSRFYEGTNNYELDRSRARNLTEITTKQSKRLLVSMEGGTVHTAERNGEYLVIINQVALLDMLGAEDHNGVEPIKELSFPTEATRDEYLRDRGWLSKRRLG